MLNMLFSLYENTDASFSVLIESHFPCIRTNWKLNNLIINKYLSDILKTLQRSDVIFYCFKQHWAIRMMKDTCNTLYAPD